MLTRNPRDELKNTFYCLGGKFQVLLLDVRAYQTTENHMLLFFVERFATLRGPNGYLRKSDHTNTSGIRDHRIGEPVAQLKLPSSIKLPTDPTLSVPLPPIQEVAGGEPLFEKATNISLFDRPRAKSLSYTVETRSHRLDQESIAPAALSAQPISRFEEQVRIVSYIETANVLPRPLWGQCTQREIRARRDLDLYRHFTIRIPLH